MNSERVDCTAQEFQAYVHKMSPAIKKVLTRLDETIKGTNDDISSGLGNLAKDYLMDPLMQIANGGGCAFFERGFRGILDGLCYRSATGLAELASSYVGTGVVALYSILVTYILWRCTVDTYSIAKDSQLSKDSVVPTTVGQPSMDSSNAGSKISAPTDATTVAAAI